MRTFHTIAILALVAAVARADNPSYLGEKPPEFGFGEVVNGVAPAKNLADLRGDVVVLEFLRTSCPGCLAVMPALDKTWRKFARPDVHVFEVTNDSVELTRRFLYHHPVGRKLGHPIAVRCRQAFGVSGVPWTYVIGRDGKVAWAGKSGAGYEKALAAAVAAPDPEMPDAPANLRKAIDHLAAERYAKALGLAAKAAEKPETADFAKYVEARVERQLGRHLATVDAHLARGDLFAAETLLADLAKRFAKTAHEARIAERREKLAAREGFGEARDAWRSFHAIADSARTGKKAAVAVAKRKLRSLDKSGDPKLGAAARDLLAVLEKPWTLADAAEFGGLCGK